jgi:malonyl-CoA/methylmalonyl-CoA synthetase
MSMGNLFAALRAAFPADLDQVAIETADTAVPLHYTWRDLDRGTAMMANLLASLKLPRSRASRCRSRRASRR